MLARLQQVITLGALMLCGTWIFSLTRLGHPAWALVGAVLVVSSYAVVLGLEFVLLGWTHGDDPAPRASTSQRLKAWWGEVLTAPRVFCWRQPFRSRAEPDFIPAESGGRRGVVLVHGFVCNRGLWNPWMRRLRHAGVPFVAVNLEPVFGSIDAYCEVLESAVQSLQAATGLPPVVVAHSMGGLAVRAWMRAANADARLHRVITIGTPHHGTWLGRFARTTNTRQMRLHGDWVKQLEAAEPRERYGRFTCFYSHCDNIVFPPSTATLPGAENRHVEGWSHVHLAFHPAVFEELKRWTAEPSALRDASGPARCSRTAP